MPNEREADQPPKQKLPLDGTSASSPAKPKTGLMHASLRAAAQTAGKEETSVEAVRTLLMQMLDPTDKASLAVIEMLDPTAETPIRLVVKLNWKEHSKLDRDRQIAAEIEGGVQSGETQSRAVAKAAKRWQVSKSRTRSIWRENRGKVIKDMAFFQEAERWA